MTFVRYRRSELLKGGPAMFFGNRGSAAHSFEAESSRLIAEAEAFLLGGYANYLRQRGATVPGWAWVNLFAHGDLHGIRQIRRSLTCRSAVAFSNSSECYWRYAQWALAKELLKLVDDDPELLCRVQRAVLVPLEFHLIYIETYYGLTTLELVQSTQAALRSNIA